MLVDDLLLRARALERAQRDGRRHRQDRDAAAQDLVELTPGLIDACTALLQALQPFVQNGWVMLDGSAASVYGDAPVFQRFALDDDGEPACWQFTRDDVRRAIAASSASY